MTDYNLIKTALSIAKEAHKGQHDKAGADYIFHPITVALLCDTAKEKAVALLHDTLEDCGDVVTYEMLTDKVGEDADKILCLKLDISEPEQAVYDEAVRQAVEKEHMISVSRL